MLRPLLGVAGLLLALAVGCAEVPVDEQRGEKTSELQDGVVGNLSGKSVLLLPFAYASPGEAECFRSNAKALLAWYVKQGAAAATSKVVPITKEPQSFIAVLEAEKAAGATYDRVITMGHGGLDGPIFDEGGQIGLDRPSPLYLPVTSASSSSSSGSEPVEDVAPQEPVRDPTAGATNRAKLVTVGGLLNAITKPKSFIYLGSCNAGTGKSEIDPAYSFVELTTCLTGRAAFGTATLTSCTDAGNRIRRLEQQDVSNMLKEGDPSKLGPSAVGLTCL